MPIPQDIRSVARPKNTIVIAYGKDKNLYAVRQRVGCRNVDGRHLPVNGPTIGHIIDGVYVPDVYHTVLHILILAVTVTGLVYVFGRKKPEEAKT